MDLACHPDCESEAKRLDALAGLAILDTPPEQDFDGLTRLAAAAMRADCAAISLVDRDRQWFKSRVGIPFAETPRGVAFCHHTVSARQTLVVKDARADPRFRDNPLVTADGGIRFYAGAPLFLSAGHCIGSLCVIDGEPREQFDAHDQAILEDLSRLVSQRIEARQRRRMGEIAAKVVETTTDAVLAADSDGGIVFLNAAAERMFGLTRDRAFGRDFDIIVPERIGARFRKRLRNAIKEALAGRPGSVLEFSARHADGTEFPVEISLAPWGVGEAEGGFAAIVRDVGDRQAIEADRDRMRAFLDTVIDNLPAMLFVKEARSRQYLLVNRKAQELVGRSAECMIGHTDQELFPKVGKAFTARDGEAIASGRPHVYESEFTKDDGERIHLRTTRVLADGPNGPGEYLLGMSEDMTEIRRAEAENYRLAHYDMLTGLLNRASLAERVRDLVKSRTRFAMLGIDLDRFKAVNDQFGHVTGDAVLKEVGARLAGMEGLEDSVARIGGDEFIALLTGDVLRGRAEHQAAEMIERISQPIKAGRVTAHIGASIGVVLFPDDGQTIETLRENADLALYRAKKEGRGKVCLFDAGMDAAMRDRRKLELDLRGAVGENRLRLQYQPIVSAATGEITSVEALARWKHDYRGAVRPDEFISVAEDCGLIEELGTQLLQRACEEALGWRGDLQVAVNLSPLQFQSGKLLDTVRETLRMTGLPPERLQIEVTERLVIQDTAQTFAQLAELRALGIQLCIDDFGVGYSSLSYFQRFPFDKVKIDKTFVAEIETSQAAKAIVQAVTGLGRQLSMAIVAEGVETERQRRLVSELGCTHLQGFLFSEPLEADKVAGLVAERGLASRSGRHAA